MSFRQVWVLQISGQQCKKETTYSSTEDLSSTTQLIAWSLKLWDKAIRKRISTSFLSELAISQLPKEVKINKRKLFKRGMRKCFGQIKCIIKSFIRILKKLMSGPRISSQKKIMSDSSPNCQKIKYMPSTSVTTIVINSFAISLAITFRTIKMCSRRL